MSACLQSLHLLLYALFIIHTHYVKGLSLALHTSFSPLEPRDFANISVFLVILYHMPAEHAFNDKMSGEEHDQHNHQHAQRDAGAV